jgi:hypothetical protein
MVAPAGIPVPEIPNPVGISSKFVTATSVLPDFVTPDVNVRCGAATVTTGGVV